jgi:hypothetical protein
VVIQRIEKLEISFRRKIICLPDLAFDLAPKFLSLLLKEQA